MTMTAMATMMMPAMSPAIVVVIAVVVLGVLIAIAVLRIHSLRAKRYRTKQQQASYQK